MLAVALIGVALAVRLATPVGADFDEPVQRMLGRAPRLDGYWYTRAAIDGVRHTGEPSRQAKFDRPGYTALCRLVYEIAGTSAATIELPALLAGALGCGLVFLLAVHGGFSPGFAALAGLFAATNWIAVLHDREPLIYSTVTLGLLVSLLGWLGGFRRPVLFAMGWLGLAVTVVTLKETALLAAPGLLLAQLVAAGPARGRRWRTAAWSGAAALLGLLVLWLAAGDFVHSLAAKVLGRTVLPDLPFPGGWLVALIDVPQSLAVVGRIPAIGVLAFVGLVAIVLDSGGETDPREAAFRWLLVGWLVGGCLIVAGFAYRPTRYLLALFPPAFLLAAHGAAVLAGRVPVAARRSPRATRLVLFFAWWLGIAAIASFVAPLLSAPPLDRVRALLSLTPVRLGVSAFLAALLASGQAFRLVGVGRLAPAPRYAVALTVFVFITDARGLVTHLARPTFDDLAARRSFEAVAGAGARVQGYAAHYLALDSRFQPVLDFSLRPQDLARNEAGSTHVATLWVPELGYVERLLAAGGKPLRVVADVVIGHERYRIYRRSDAEARGYTLTAFERARLLEQAGTASAAATAYRSLLAAGAFDPVVLAHAGAALGRIDPAEGQAVLRRALLAAPNYPLSYLFLADLLERDGAADEALELRTRASLLLPHELILGLGPSPRPG